MNRRSIRKYKEDKVPKEIVNKLVKAALLSPSSRRINPWEFIIVEDKEILEKLSGAKKHGSTFLRKAPLGIVVIADENKSDVWVEDTSIASIILQLTAQSLDLGSCWIQIRNRMHNDTITSEEYIRDLLHIPTNYKVESIISIGYPDEERPPQDVEKLQYEKLQSNQYQNPYSTDTK